MDILSAVISGFGLAAPAGLNAWLPLLIVGLLGRFTNLIKLQAPFDALTNTWVLVALVVLLTIELFADKIAAVDSVNDMIHTFIRPVAGGILFAAHSLSVGGLDPTLSFVLGVLSAGGIHAVKATSRPMITATTGGIGNPIVSFLEDIVAAIVTVLALTIWPVAAFIMALVLAAAIYALWRFRGWRRRRREARL